ncbi:MULTISPECIES: AbrB family transcriptional regulator [Priestia]|uniref:AbrB family transcriptional regulator n=1 Tax=Priestia TaxID=2800373 RepID=UPI001C8D6458|nr:MULTISPECIES: AbrB family transcriptional regulator [Priestia]MBX9996895.1 AbrB family transcriptional regulator [Priestia aryabhattai]MED4061134.1 AbrB family transcriptional regulator [Priestia megaterium]
MMPVELRKNFNVDKEDYMEIFLEDNHIKIQKFEEFNRCAITAEITPENQECGNDLILSPLGCRNFI